MILFNDIENDVHEFWMRKALEQARLAGDRDEVPVGAVLVRGDEIIASGFNQVVGTSDPTAHAEIVTLRTASQFEQNYRLPGTILYASIEPCTMCVGALIHARIDALVFGAREPRAGAVVSQQSLLDQAYYNHRLAYKEGVLAEECSELVKSFFRAKRLAK